MALRMVKKVCLQAVHATFFPFPAARRRSYKACICGLERVATRGPLANTVRTCARPPQIMRRPRQVPLAPWRGATPTHAALWCRWRAPHAGRARRTVRAHTGPLPEARGQRAALSRHHGLARRRVSRASSSVARRAGHQGETANHVATDHITYIPHPFLEF